MPYAEQGLGAAGGGGGEGLPAPAHSTSEAITSSTWEGSVTGVQLAQGIGVRQARGFWAEAWAQVISRTSAILAMTWLGIVAFFAVAAPWLASGHPLILRELDAGGNVVKTTYPLFEYVTPGDIAILVGSIIGVCYVFLGPKKGRAARLGHTIAGAVFATIAVIISKLIGSAVFGSTASAWARSMNESGATRLIVPGLVGLAVLLLGLAIPFVESLGKRLAVLAAACVVAAGSTAAGWNAPLERFDYVARERRGEIRATYTLIPFSASERFSSLDRKEPMTTLGEGLEMSEGEPGAGRVFVCGTDAFGQDVLANLLDACRLSITIGLVSTGIAVIIGVTLGALMGYFGGWVDIALSRVVEIFMAIPVLFLLIVAAGVLPPEYRSTYTLMVIIGCFSWMSSARFTRAEFLKLRNQDFVQSAQSVGLPLPRILFQHMLPNGVTPVLVDASFAIAAAISVEAILSYLGLGAANEASWGKLLASAVSSEGIFKWWLAVFPGAAIFLTVFAYNLLGEALRDAIDPKLKKARV